MKKNIFLIISTLFFIPSIISAASISLSSLSNVNTGESFKVLVSIDSENTSINSVDIIVDFDASLVDFVGFQDSDTLFKNWIQTPSVLEKGRIHMTGIVPGGVVGIYDPNKKELNDISVVSLLFKSKQEGVAHFTFHKNDILKNDGLGTSIYPSTKNLAVSIKTETNLSQDDSSNSEINIVDIIPPLPFTISFIPSSDISNTKDMIAFIAQDLESGIREYRLKKGEIWETVSSPLVINKNILPQKITIRAYDNNSNYTESSIAIEGILPLWGILFILIFFVLSSFFLYKLVK